MSAYARRKRKPSRQLDAFEPENAALIRGLSLPERLRHVCWAALRPINNLSCLSKYQRLYEQGRCSCLLTCRNRPRRRRKIGLLTTATLARASLSRQSGRGSRTEGPVAMDESNSTCHKLPWNADPGSLRVSPLITQGDWRRSRRSMD
jgi:hypothetical protein